MTDIERPDEEPREQDGTEQDQSVQPGRHFVEYPQDSAELDVTVSDEAEAASAEVRTTPWWRGVLEFIIAFAIMILVIFGLRAFVIEPFEIPSGSMLQTIQIGDRVFAEKVSIELGIEPKAGQIITFINPRDPSETLIKRVIAVGGQTVDLQDGVVYVDGEPLDEPYTDGQATNPMRSDLSYVGAVLGVDENGQAIVNETGSYTGATITYPYTVPEGYFWVMGDNRGNSSDSRVFGAVSFDAVTGHAIFRYWPFFYTIDEEDGSSSLSFALGPLN